MWLKQVVPFAATVANLSMQLVIFVRIEMGMLTKQLLQLRWQKVA
jgi:hypothetical protein